VETRAIYEPIVFEMLPAMRAEDWSAAWTAFLQTCRALGKRDAWRDVCTQAERVDPASGRHVQTFFASRFDAYRVLARRFEARRNSTPATSA